MRPIIASQHLAATSPTLAERASNPSIRPELLLFDWSNQITPPPHRRPTTQAANNVSFVSLFEGPLSGSFNSIYRSGRKVLGIEQTPTKHAGRAPKLLTEGDLRVASLANLPVELLGNIYDNLDKPIDWIALRCSNSALASSMPPKIRNILLTRICNYSLSVSFSYDTPFLLDAATFAPLWQTKRALTIDCSGWSSYHCQNGKPGLPNLQKLETLKLIGPDNFFDHLPHRDPKLAYSLFDKTPELQSLEIENYLISSEQMPPLLRKIPKLKHLDIHQNLWGCDLNMILKNARELQSFSIQKTYDPGFFSVEGITEDNHTLESLTCSFALALQVDTERLQKLKHLVNLRNLTINNNLGANIACLWRLQNVTTHYVFMPMGF